jgi:hypothetical protein
LKLFHSLFGTRNSLLLQPAREIRHHGNGLAHLLQNAIEQNLFAVGSHVIEELRRRGPVGEDLLRRAELRSPARIPYRNSEKTEGSIQVVQLFSVMAPGIKESAVGLDLPFRLPAAEGHHINFRELSVSNVLTF